MKRIKQAIARQKHSEAVKLYEYDLIQEAMPKFREAVQLAPCNSKFWQSIALVQMEEGNFKEALKSINKLFKFKSVNRDYLYVLKGDTFMKQNSYKKALRSYCCVSPKNKHTQGIKSRKIKCLMALGDYKRALKISPGFVHSVLRNEENQIIWSSEEIEFLQGVCHFYLRDYSQAVKYLNKAAANTCLRNNPQLLFYKGSSHYNIGEYQKAIICLQEVLALGNSQQEGVPLILMLAKQKVAQNQYKIDKNNESQQDIEEQMSSQKSEEIDFLLKTPIQLVQVQMMKGKFYPEQQQGKE